MKPKKKNSKVRSFDERRRIDALALAQLIYDIYVEKKSRDDSSSSKSRAEDIL